VYLKKIIYILLFTVNAVAAAMDASDRASALYENMDWKGALSEYEKLIDEGYTNWQIYFNAGNCFFRMGDFPRARLYYLRAERRMPREKDIKYNLSIVGKKLNLREENAGFLILFIKYFSMSEVKNAVVGTFWILMILTALFIIKRREFFVWSGAFVFIVWVFEVSVLYGKAGYEKKGKCAVVLEKENMLSGPGTSYKVIAEIPAGCDIQIYDREEGWVFAKVSTSGGWIREDAIEKI